MTKARLLDATDTFARRHIASRETDVREMLDLLGFDSLDGLMDAVIPHAIRRERPLDLPAPAGEREALEELQEIASKNRVFRSYIGLGYYDSVTPGVVQRNVLENPGWYTQYTPYQAEIAQGRLEALLNFQTMVTDLTALPIANASLLDEGTAAAEAMSLCHAAVKGKRDGIFVADNGHPQTLEVIRTRAEAIGLDLHVGDPKSLTAQKVEELELCGVLLHYPATDGRIEDWRSVIQTVHDGGAMVVMATDLLALTLLTPPGELGADVAIGSAQRFGVPLGYGGPHAAFLAAAKGYERKMPGRIVGVSKDAKGHPAFRLSLQPREQHIRREKATSNICTAQVLLAVMASMYAVYHGPEGLRQIAERVHGATRVLAEGLRRLGHDPGGGAFFDTLRVVLGHGDAESIHAAAVAKGINLRRYDDGAGDGAVGVALDETVGREDLADLFEVFALGREIRLDPDALAAELFPNGERPALDPAHRRASEYLGHEVFHRHHSEHEMLRYIKQLEERDLSLAFSMIPLGSCTMKLNATSEMIPIGWPGLSKIHPFAPVDQVQGYAEMIGQLEAWLSEVTGFAAVSVQPNAGSQGELAGLLVIRAWHRERGEGHRNVCLIPTSAHGTNPASAVMAGMKVVSVACDDQGDIDLDDLQAKAEAHKDNLAALMITYPSTHGVFEQQIERITATVHDCGGQVYLDGANMNAQVGLTRPGDYGADVCHLNLHKTFCIPHGGGGPGVGPIGVAAHLAPFLPGHPLVPTGGDKAIGPIAAAPWGSASILPISWTYIRMMGAEGLTQASRIAVLHANYMAKRLSDHYPVLYTGETGFVAHEFIADMRDLKKTAGVSVLDIAKRLMDYGFHAPTVSFPEAETMMIEPTESEPKAELDRFCDALIAIREEIRAIEEGRADREDNVLHGAPHTALAIAEDDWSHPYSREQAAYPAAWVKKRKFWPPVGRIDDAWGDKNLVCTCLPMEAYEEGGLVEA